ncbi:protein FAM200A-like [Sipha flava]|uniref:Protein FAM200A-like n=1 Tax=Sipha flava TaxID=143950 RepID=A0A8B8FU15_9HEMI|nr:protein FAM200A-like [Sipha flava]
MQGKNENILTSSDKLNGFLQKINLQMFLLTADIDSDGEFWHFIKPEYPIITEIAINILLPFSTTYLCELGFSALTNIKNKKRERFLSVEQEMRVCLLSIPQRIELLCKQHQAQVSH